MLIATVTVLAFYRPPTHVRVGHYTKFTGYWLLTLQRSYIGQIRDGDDGRCQIMTIVTTHLALTSLDVLVFSPRHLKNVGTIEFGRVRPSVCLSRLLCPRGTLHDFLLYARHMLHLSVCTPTMWTRGVVDSALSSWAGGGGGSTGTSGQY